MPPRLPIYLDHHATTPVDPRVLSVMLPYFTDEFGNAASRSHGFGNRANDAVEAARLTVASALGAESAKEIVFTSGATESNNLAIKGVAEAYASKGRHLVTTAIEHKSVLDTMKHLESQGFEVTVVGVNGQGRVAPEAIVEAIRHDTILVSVMLANNEVGTVQPVDEIGTACRERGVLFHVDASQGWLKVPFTVKNVDLCSVTAHKMYGPKGVGALYVRRQRPRVRLVGQMDGGGHEQKMRSGTLNVPGIVGLAAAVNIMLKEGAEENRRLAALRDRLNAGITSRLSHVTRNGDPEHALPGNLNLSFHYVEGEGLMLALADMALSSGSACTSASLSPSYVLGAMGIDRAVAHCSIRFGLGRGNTEEQMDYVAERVTSEVTRLRGMSPLYDMVLAGIDPSQIAWS